MCNHMFSEIVLTPIKKSNLNLKVNSPKTSKIWVAIILDRLCDALPQVQVQHDLSGILFRVRLHTHHLGSLSTRQQLSRSRHGHAVIWFNTCNNHPGVPGVHIANTKSKALALFCCWRTVFAACAQNAHVHTLSPMLTLVKLSVCRWMLEARMAGATVSTSTFSRYWPMKGQACWMICTTHTHTHIIINQKHLNWVYMNLMS